MTAASISRPLLATAAMIKRLARCSKGIAAVEFAFVVPIMLCLFIGVVELSQAITVDRRVSHVASSTADLVARQRNVTTPTLNGYMQIVDNIMAPYSATNLKVTIASVYNTTAAPTTHTICWAYHHNSGAKPGYAANGTYTGMPANILDAAGGTSVIVVDASYLYQPVLFFSSSNISINGTQVSSFVGSAGITMSETFYLKPRLSSSVQLDSNTSC